MADIAVEGAQTSRGGKRQAVGGDAVSEVGSAAKCVATRLLSPLIVLWVDCDG